ncbi:MAG: hypothetical protein HKP29_02920, partial [Silicimonas sp.]|nr:hypothetical protein [Silicimonas sp.]
MTDAAAPRDVSPSSLGRLLGALKSLIVGTLLCMTPLTSVLVLGWLMRRMRRTAFRAAGLPPGPRPGWMLGERGSGAVSRLLGGLGANIREGLLALTSLFVATMPFTLIWLLSWWAGWENSFSKGYEQAFVGPLLGLAGVAVFCVIMAWLPLAQVHQAVENRAFALFDWRRVRSVVRHTGWGYLAFALASVVLAMPIFAGRGLIAFASDAATAYMASPAAEVLALPTAIMLVKSVYVFVLLVILRGWAARIYAASVRRALAGPDAALWTASPLRHTAPGGRRAWVLTHWVRTLLLSVIWFGLAT